jgi:hypothetical protein
LHIKEIRKGEAMAQKDPSKYLSLAFLKEARENYCKSPNGIEYHADELDLLIAEKEERKLAEMEKAELAYYAEMEVEIEEEEIPFPTDADFCEELEAVIIDVAIIEEIENTYCVELTVKLVFAYDRKTPAKTQRKEASANVRIVRRVKLRLVMQKYHKP